MANQEHLDLLLKGVEEWNEHRPNLYRADLIGADLSRAKLSGADLRNTNLIGANLSGADLRNTNLIGADLRQAILSGANLSGADLSWASLHEAYLTNTNLDRAIMKQTDLSGTRGLIKPSDWLLEHGHESEEGLIFYKAFNQEFNAPEHWKIEKGAILREVVNFDRTSDCACGVNVATREWVAKNCKTEVWKVLIPWDRLSGVCVPYHTDGKIRAEYVILLGKVKDDV